MPKHRRKAAEEKKIDCEVRVMTKAGKTVIEIALDEEAAIALAAKLVRRAG